MGGEGKGAGAYISVLIPPPNHPNTRDQCVFTSTNL